MENKVIEAAEWVFGAQIRHDWNEMKCVCVSPGQTDSQVDVFESMQVFDLRALAMTLVEFKFSTVWPHNASWQKFIASHLYVCNLLLVATCQGIRDNCYFCLMHQSIPAVTIPPPPHGTTNSPPPGNGKATKIIDISMFLTFKQSLQLSNTLLFQPIAHKSSGFTGKFFHC